MMRLRRILNRFLGRRSAAAGVYLIEMTLAMPFIVYLGFSSIQVVTYMRRNEILSSISRQGANGVFRECTKLYSEGPEPEDSVVAACLQNRMAALKGFVTNFEDLIPPPMPGTDYSNFGIILKFYVYDKVGTPHSSKCWSVTSDLSDNEITGIDNDCDDADASNGQFESKISFSEIGTGDNQSLGMNKPYLSTAEVFLINRDLPIVSYLSLEGGVVYEPTVF